MEQINVVETLREAGPDGLHVDEIAARTDQNALKLGMHCSLELSSVVNNFNLFFFRSRLAPLSHPSYLSRSKTERLCKQ